MNVNYPFKRAIDLKITTHLDTDHNDQRGCYGDSKCLLIRDLGAVVAYSGHEGSVRDEEKNERGADPMQRTREKLSLVEKLVELTRSVQVWIT